MYLYSILHSQCILLPLFSPSYGVYSIYNEKSLLKVELSIAQIFDMKCMPVIK